MSRIFQAFLQNEDSIRRVIARYFRKPEDIDELTQEVFVKCFAAEMKAEIWEPKFFLLRSAKNLALSELKKKARTTTDSIEDSGGPDVYKDEVGISAETRLDSKRKLAALAQAIASLPPNYRRAFWMRKIEGLKLAQIAAQLNISVSTAKKRVADALLKCEAHLREKGYEPGEFGPMPTTQHNGSRLSDSVSTLSASAGGQYEFSDE